MNKLEIKDYIKTECGQLKYKELASRTGFLAKCRLYWFIFFAILRDFNVDIKIREKDQNLD